VSTPEKGFDAASLAGQRNLVIAGSRTGNQAAGSGFAEMVATAGEDCAEGVASYPGPAIEVELGGMACFALTNPGCYAIVIVLLHNQLSARQRPDRKVHPRP
jgi:hypothetical protein